MSSHPTFALALTALLVASGAAVAKTACPAAVTKAAENAYPAASLTGCKQEKEKGKIQYEVKLQTKDAKKMELDISPEGSILLTEEAVAVGSVPQAVMAAFAAKYPKMKAASADKQTRPDGSVSYELAFRDAKGKRHEATFKDDATFVEEE